MSLDTQIQAIFDHAGLSENERELWTSRLTTADERMRAVFVSVFSGDADLLRFFTEDLHHRIEAGTNREKLDRILESEREYFRALLREASDDEEEKEKEEEPSK